MELEELEDEELEVLDELELEPVATAALMVAEISVRRERSAL